MAVSLSSAWRVLCLFQSVSLLIVQDALGHLQSYDDSQHFSILWTENGMSKEVSLDIDSMVWMTCQSYAMYINITNWHVALGRFYRQLLK